MSLPLPPELLEKIASLVPDKATLGSLALAGAPFISPSQRTLFKTLRVVYSGVGSEGAPISLINDLFASSPHLASYVRELTIVLSGRREHADHPALISLLARVHRLDHLILSGSSPIPSREDMQDLPDDVVSALVDGFAQPSLQRLTLSYLCDPPPALLLATMGVPVVSFDVVWLISGHPLIRNKHLLAPNAPLPRLRELATMQSTLLDSIFEFLVSDMGQAYACQLRTLELHVGSDMPPYICRLLTLCAANLERFAVTFSPGIIPLFLPIPLSHLRELNLRVFLDGSGDFPSHFCHNLANITSSPLLETLTLRSMVCAPQNLWLEPRSEEGPHWAPFGVDFPNRSTEVLPHLRRVECILSVNRAAFNEWKADEVFSRFVESMKTRLPGLSRGGETPLLVFSLSVGQ